MASCGAARAVTGLRDGGEPGHRNVGTALLAIAEAARRQPGGRVVDVDQRPPGSGYLSSQPLKLWLGANKGVADAFGIGVKGQGQLSNLAHPVRPSCFQHRTPARHGKGYDRGGARLSGRLIGGAGVPFRAPGNWQRVGLRAVQPAAGSGGHGSCVLSGTTAGDDAATA